MKVLVTGGGGFIGSHLAERLLEEGHAVRVLDNFATGRRENLTDFASAIELIEDDIQSYERVHTAVQGVDIVFHQAALPSVPRSVQDPLTSTRRTLSATRDVLLRARAAEGGRGVVVLGVGKSDSPPKAESLTPAPDLAACDGGAEDVPRPSWDFLLYDQPFPRRLCTFHGRREAVGSPASLETRKRGTRGNGTRGTELYGR